MAALLLFSRSGGNHGKALDPDDNTRRAPGVELLPLEFAARRGNAVCCETLLALGASADPGMPYLWVAYTDNVQVMKLLQAHGADPFKKATYHDNAILGATALHYAASNNCRAAIRHLIVDLGAPDSFDNDGHDVYWHIESGGHHHDRLDEFVRGCFAERVRASERQTRTRKCTACAEVQPESSFGQARRTQCIRCYAASVRQAQAALYPCTDSPEHQAKKETQFLMQEQRAAVFLRLAKGLFEVQATDDPRPGRLSWNVCTHALLRVCSWD